MKKGDLRKVIRAAIAKGRTAVGNEWLSHRLAMGHRSSRCRRIASRAQKVLVRPVAMEAFRRGWLEIRFGGVPQGLREELEALDDEATLHGLLR